MADNLIIVPFEKSSEGGYVNSPLDRGKATNKGVTFAVFISFFGYDLDRFIRMSDADWSVIFKSGYWDKIRGDEIDSQSIANLLADWVYCSGKYYPLALMQKVLMQVYNIEVDENGVMDDISLAAINNDSADDDEAFFNELTQAHIDFVNQIVAEDPSQNIFHQGWLNRIAALKKFCYPNS